MKLKILYEDKDILAIDKPSGVMVHEDGRSKEETITDWVIKKYPKLKGIGEPVTFSGEEIDRPGIVHRLDKETSGVLLIMKTKEAFAYFKKQFMDRKIEKTYYAIVSGFVKKDHEIINKPIGRSPKDFRRRLAGRGARGEMREAITKYKVLKRFEAKCIHFSGRCLRVLAERSLSARRPVRDPKNECTLPLSYLEIHPKTGRTHQIRVHMKYINHPVVCDSLYDPKGVCPKGLDRLALHAKSIEFKGLNGKKIKIESLIPKEFAKIVKGQ